MADNFISRILDSLMGRLASAMMDQTRKQFVESIVERRAYRQGWQRESLKVKANQSNDNVTLNLIGKAVDQSLSMLFGESLAVDLGGVDDDADPQLWLNNAWKANRGEVLLKRLGMMGADAGICYAKIIPNAKQLLGVDYPRLIALDPLYMEVYTEPSDYEKVMRYVYEYATEDPETQKEVKYKQVFALEDGAWIVRDYQTQPGASKYELTNEENYTEANGVDFSPVLNWQNLPSVAGIEGKPDVTGDIIQLQDKINYAASNINKIIRLNAHPRWYATGFGSGQLATINWGPEEMLKLPNDSQVGSAEMSSELEGSREWVKWLTQSLYSLMRSVDVATVKDKLGQLTNFGVRMLYQDALAKNNDKRDLYGEAIEELSRRMLKIGGVYSESLEPIRVVWPEPLPNSEKEEIEAIAKDLDYGLVSAQTASGKRGYDWSVEQERIADEKAAEGNVGDEILRLFETGRGA